MHGPLNVKKEHIILIVIHLVHWVFINMQA